MVSFDWHFFEEKRITPAANSIKSNRGQNVRLVVSCCRFVVSSFLCVTSLLCSVFSSTNSSPRLVAPLTSFPCFDLSLVSSFRFFDVSFRRFASAI